MKRLVVATTCGLAILLSRSASAGAGADAEAAHTRYGLAAARGVSYNPHGVSFLTVNGCAVSDYDPLLRHRLPATRRFKIEGNVGSTTGGDPRLIASANMLALTYLRVGEPSGVRFFGEAGIGVIYTGFQVEGQGLRLNFNPQAGIGVEFDTATAGAWYATLRLHHVSNGGLDAENRGINSVVLLLGRYFPR